jgi:transcriptional regulator with XRE-family HTH domain
MKQQEQTNSKIKDSSLANNLCEQIEARRQKLDISVRSLERKAGLNIGAVNNILHGVSSNPTAETLIALANVFECSIDELVSRKGSAPVINKKPEVTSDNFAAYKWNSNLYLEALEVLNKELSARKNSELNFKQALNILQALCFYSLKKNKSHIEESMADWLLDKEL